MVLLHNHVRTCYLFPNAVIKTMSPRATLASCQVMLYKVVSSCCRLSSLCGSRVEDEIRPLSLILRAEIIPTDFFRSYIVCLDKGPEGPYVFGPINMRLLFV